MAATARTARFRGARAMASPYRQRRHGLGAGHGQVAYQAALAGLPGPCPSNAMLTADSDFAEVEERCSCRSSSSRPAKVRRSASAGQAPRETPRPTPRRHNTIRWCSPSESSVARIHGRHHRAGCRQTRPDHQDRTGDRVLRLRGQQPDDTAYRCPAACRRARSELDPPGTGGLPVLAVAAGASIS